MATLIGTSWKMNLTSTDAARYCQVLLPLVVDVTDCDLFILPPFTSIWAVRDRLKGSRVSWGAQAVHPADWGAHTGDVSAPMLADLECAYVEVGHAERRRDHGEANGWIAAQIAAVQRWGMTAILCVGETERTSIRRAMERIEPQLAVLRDADARRLVIAYEPSWAIGEGAEAAEPGWVGQVHTEVRGWLTANLTGGASIPVIYGGSVDSSAARAILAQPATNGLFVGRHALDPIEFARIAHLAQGVRPVGTPSDEPARTPAKRSTRHEAGPTD